MFRRLTVDGVLAGFRKAIDDLSFIDEAQRLEAARQTDIILAAEVARTDALSEAERARNIADRLAALIK